MTFSTLNRIILAGTATLFLSGVAISQEMITVKAGDNLSKIALEKYDDASMADAICEANSGKLANCDVLEVGQQLALPAMDKDAMMAKETMEKEAMEKATMEKEAMEKATMEKEAMEKATMEKEAMEKATMEKEAMEKAKSN